MVSVGTQKSNGTGPLRIVRLAQFNQAQINIFVREWIEQQERVSPEDKNEEKKKLINVDYVCGRLVTSFPEEANSTQKDTLFTFFSQSSGFHFPIFDTSIPSLFLWKLSFFIYYPPLHILPPIFT